MKEVVVDIALNVLKVWSLGLYLQRYSSSVEVEIQTRDLYDLEKGRVPKEHGALDTKMGISSNAQECSTCHGNLASCHGHFGHIRLALPVFHVGYFKVSFLFCSAFVKAVLQFY